MSTRGRGGFGLPGTKAVKQARATAAQKSSHQNMRARRRRASRATVMRAEMRKNDKAETVVEEGECDGNRIRRGNAYT